MTRALLLILVGSSTAYADVCAAPPSGNSDVRWVVAGGMATACFRASASDPEACWAFAGGRPANVAVPKATPAVASAPFEVRESGGALSACAGGKCTAVGKAATAAVAAARKEVADTKLAVGGDGSVLVISAQFPSGTREMWNIKTDKQLTIAEPPGGGGGMLVSLEVVGGAIVATWTTCAGPCGTQSIVDANGKSGKAWEAGQAVDLGGGRIAFVPAMKEGNDSIRVVDVATSKSVAAKFPPADYSTATRLDGSTLAVASYDAGAWRLRTIAVAAGRAPVVGTAHPIPTCKSP